MNEETPKLRLLKVVVQPVFAVDDGHSLTERAAEPVVVPASEWADYPTTGFAEAMRSLQEELDRGAGLGG